MLYFYVGMEVQLRPQHAHCSLLTTHYSLFFTLYSLYSLLTTHRPLLTAHYQGILSTSLWTRVCLLISPRASFPQVSTVSK